MMRVFMLCAVVVLSANAGEGDAEENVCQVYYELAKNIMKLRQINHPMPDAMKLAGGEKLIERLVVKAYGQPAFSVESNQQISINKFANDAFNACYQSRSDDSQ